MLQIGYCATTYHDNVTIKVGSNLRNAGGTIVKIDQIILHPDFQIESLSNDFAILVPNVKLVFSESVQPIKILCHCKPLLDGTPCNVTGWGLSERRVFPVHLRSTDIFVVNQVQKSFFSH